jgi:hypothetical protein
MNNSYAPKYLIPDAFFTLSSGGHRHFFLLEMDRGTIAAKLMLKRYQCYYDWWRQKGYKSDFGATSIRILTVTTNQKRMENLIKSCYQVKGNNAGSAVFWFTTIKHIDIFRPQAMLNHVWRKALPNDSSLYSLLD